MQENPMRKTKIICTLGPATDDDEVLRGMMLEGMNVARLNFSHSTHEEHKRRAEQVKRLREALGLPIALLADTKGPEIRLGTFAQAEVLLKAGDIFTLTTEEVLGTELRASVSYKGLSDDVLPGARLLIDDGKVELRAETVSPSEIVCRVVNGGTISAHKSVNVPGAFLNMPFLSSADRADIRFAVENDFDYIAASFTRRPGDIIILREELRRLRCDSILVIAKIENAGGVNNIDAILPLVDGIMVARGDLGVEMPLEEIPAIQKKLIHKAYNAGKIVVTATQMLESMTDNPRPTRAEVNDVANAIYDGTSAIMLSGETAMGHYPVETVKTMDAIARRTERDIDYKKRFRNRLGDEAMNITNAVSHATVAAAHDLDGKAVIALTKSGNTARMISKYRPACTIIGCSTEEKAVRQMNLSWGVSPILMAEESSTDTLFPHAVAQAEKANLLTEGDLVVITAGVPLGISGTTNMMRILVVGEPL
ncbi:MAG: pyruvate kinase [Oscillospiraceae bacterium]|jgi:pyruvate kinase|nr:pyruvate kinase [Oscillospiraceae bacterium]